VQFKSLRTDLWQKRYLAESQRRKNKEE